MRRVGVYLLAYELLIYHAMNLLQLRKLTTKARIIGESRTGCCRGVVTLGGVLGSGLVHPVGNALSRVITPHNTDISMPSIIE